MMNMIVASSDMDQLEELQNGARRVAEEIKPRVQIDIRFATSVEQIVRKRSAQTALVIVAATLPQGRASPNVDREPGLSFVKLLAADPTPLPCILVSENLEHYRTVQDFPHCELLRVDSSTNYLEQCVRLARKLGVISATANGGQASPQKKKFALLEVKLPEDANLGVVCLEYYERPGTGKEVQENTLQLDQSELKEMIKDSKVLRENLAKWQQDHDKWQHHYDQWHRNYQRLGDRVHRLLWGSQSFRELYYTGKGQAEGNIRVRFNLQEPWFEGLWEAIPQEKQGERHLILDNIITRRVFARNRKEKIGGEAPQIDTVDGVLNMLVIQSDVPHLSTPRGPADPLWRKYWASHDAKLPMLRHLEEEVRTLRELTRSKRGSATASRVKIDVLKPPQSSSATKAWSFADKVESQLTKRSHRYDIVHFAGHALFDKGPVKEDSRGYLVFSGFPDPEAVPIARFASWLKDAGVQLVYLSCCRSSAASAALELARNEIPMAIGFHWDLDDSKAPVFAQHFYRELLAAELKVCPAISKARSKLFDNFDKGDPIWASPVLIAQPADWVAVEGVLKFTGKQQQAQSAG